MTREQALEQIRQRRGRARSIAEKGTPRRILLGTGEVKEVRSISTPAKVRD
jgi:hypothetical protein